MLVIYLFYGYPAWTWEYTAAFVSTPRESPSIHRVVWGGARALHATIFLQNGGGCQKLGGKNVLWLEKIGWVGIFFLPWGFFTIPSRDIFLTPPPGMREKIIPHKNVWDKLFKNKCSWGCKLLGLYCLKIPENTITSFTICILISVIQVDEKTNELYARIFDIGAKRDSSSDGEIRFPKSKGIAGHVATTGETLNITNAYDDPR